MPDPKQSGLSDNSLGAIAYLTFVPAFVFLAVSPYNKKPSVRFHAWQSILLNVFAFLLSYALSFCITLTIPLGPAGFLTLKWLIWLVWLLFFLALIWCMVSALNGRRFKLPLIGAWAEKQANS